MNNQNNQSNPKRRQDDITLQLIADNMKLMHEDVSDLRNDMKESLKDISTALSALVLVEERQAHSKVAMQRLEDRLDKTDTRVSAIEKELPETRLVTGWVLKGVLGALAILGAAVIKLVILA